MKSLVFTVALFVAFLAASVSAQEKLTPQQIDALKMVKANTEKQSAPYALKLAATVKRIYENMLSEKEDQKLRRKLSKQLHYNAGKLLDIRGQSYRDALAILTPAQRQIVREALKKPDAPTDIGEVIEKTFTIK